EIKKQYKDYLLFYRLGDFYEMFFDDAKVASRELDLTLTGRDCGEAERAPMCGVPFHSSESYIGKLIEKGYKVAICEQTEDPALAKGLVKREVVRVVTPGTLLETNLLSEARNNYLCTVYVCENECGISFADVSTAQVYATEFGGEDMLLHLKNEIGAYAPSEIIFNIGLSKVVSIENFLRERSNALISENQPHRFEYDDAVGAIEAQFGADALEKIRGKRALACAVGALLGYVKETQKGDISYIKELNVYGDGQFLEMDVNTRRNLELTETMRTKEKKGSLLWVLDKTKTAAGARMLRKWIESPLLSAKAIALRQSAVKEFFENFMLREETSVLLSDVLDLERLISKIVYGTANAKDLRAVANTLKVVPEIKKLLSACESPELLRIVKDIDELADVLGAIECSIVDDPPFSVRDGGMIRDGYNADVDYLRSVMSDGKGWIAKIEAEEREVTGIKTLKIGYNRVFGYYIEVTKSFLDMVPDRYIRKQTLTGCERYITQDLKDKESTILGAADKICSLEYDLFQQIRAFVADSSERIQKTAALLATIDVYMSLGAVAAHNKYVCPEVEDGDAIYIKDGRHPVVEQFVKDTYFVPNDVDLDCRQKRLMLITGPNMAGKSTYMRQVALITVMAQIGSFVPASDARIGIVDKVFTRVGASDDLASGQSTFMLEMNEVAYILKNATRRSLIVYDEIGRGTSTFDGMSIARAIAEYTNSKKIGAKTLFATHYHELTTLEDEFEGIVNYNIAAKKRGDSITFLRKIVKGSTDDSYGIEVAKLAGLPNEVVKRAKEVLSSIEKNAPVFKSSEGAEQADEPIDDTLISFDDLMREQAIEELKSVDLNTLSPYEAMQLLFELQRKLK
ncbi:MAG: DNA mismatch repair protein MutS, partial [Ruminococcaceae bacterium]|nr:DNA mismatch repair protein MutS [Oscillospiraceae bacterium]